MKKRGRTVGWLRVVRRQGGWLEKQSVGVDRVDFWGIRLGLSEEVVKE